MRPAAPPADGRISKPCSGEVVCGVMAFSGEVDFRFTVEDASNQLNKNRPHPASALAAMFTIRASRVALKKNDTNPWTMTVRRMLLAVTATSETCDVMPITSEK